MSDLLELARWVGPLQGSPRSLRLAGDHDLCSAPHEGETVVWTSSRFLPHRHSRRDLLVRRYLRFPGTGGGFVLLDADNPAVFRSGTVLLPGGRSITRLAGRLVRVSSHLGVQRSLAIGELVLVENGGGASLSLQERFPGLPAGLAWNIASGVPGRDQKTIVQLVTPDGRVVAYAKIAHNEHSRALVSHEAHALERLAALDVGAPHCLGFESGAHGTLLVQSALEGETWRGGFAAPQARFLERLERATASRLPLEEVPSHRIALARLDVLKDQANPGWWHLFHELAAQLRSAADGRALPCAMAHGDFTPWNSVIANGEVRAFDWEHSRELAPRLHDAFHFVLQQAVLVERVDPRRLRALIEARTRGLQQEAWLVQLGAYVLDISVSDETIQLAQRSPFAQVDWLRGARVELARILIQELKTREACAA